MNKRIIQAELALEKARKRLGEVISSVQSTCKHPIDFVYEAEYRPGNDLLYACPPFMICSKCGLAETGWGIGYHTLPRSELTIARAKGEAMVKHMISEEEKCELYHKKKVKANA